MLKETKRLKLRKLSIDDAQEMYALAKDADVGPRCGWKPHESVKETRMLLDKFLINDNTWAITDRYKGALIGLISLEVDGKRRVNGYRMMGYWIGKQYWGQGIVVEAANEVLRYGFEDLGLRMVSISHFIFNNQSKRVIEKLGFTYEGHLRESFQIYTGEMFDEVCYSMLDSEFHKRNQ